MPCDEKNKFEQVDDTQASWKGGSGAGGAGGALRGGWGLLVVFDAFPKARQSGEGGEGGEEVRKAGGVCSSIRLDLLAALYSFRLG